jgi:hypothetical protein
VRSGASGAWQHCRTKRGRRLSQYKSKFVGQIRGLLPEARFWPISGCRKESLRRWRADLAVAISSVDSNLFPDELSSASIPRSRRSFSEPLELDADLKKSSPMRCFKRGVTDLIISTVSGHSPRRGGWPAGGLGRDPRSRSKGRGEGSRPLFWGESGEAAAKRALRSHYAVFSQPGD